MVSMEESTKKKIHEIEIVAAIVLVFVSVTFLFPKPGITGYVSYETKTHEVNLTIANSQSYILTTNSNETFYVTSLKLSAEVIGDGIAKVYVSDGKDQKILVYSNIIKEKEGFGAITGMNKITGKAVGFNSETEEDQLVIAYLDNIEEELGEIAQDERLDSGNFDSICIDSCFIEMLLNKELSYQLLFYVEEGTILKVNKIIYTVRKD